MKLLKKKCVYGFHGAKAALNDGWRMAGQRGRSMVEMLGVLAVIGVLSVGGISAYRYAMQQITLNKVGEVMTLFGLSIVPEDTIYETLRLEDGSFDQETDCSACPTHFSIDATLLFADTYGLKCPDETLSDKNWGDFGCPIGNDVWFAIEFKNRIVFNITKRKNGNDAFFTRVVQRVRDSIKLNSDLMDLYYGIAGPSICFANRNFETCFKKFEDPSQWWKGFEIHFDY